MKKIALAIATLLTAITVVHAAPDAKRPDMSKLCQGKALNSKVVSKHGDRTIEGSCQIGFKANNPQALERGAMRNPAVQNTCKGKAKGTAAVVKVDGKNIAGKCDITFKPNMRR
ncbi:hypothetical protein GFH30_06820 [Acinetobacter wanghuae]|uniref:DUF3617 family protein n=1 Tax=Acinetobacter wanghuae TaxID=2662362 RepID=A0A5Q0P3X7_9GAMM|nr:hypothetical protein [Acinetobacter wanghuae]MQW92539.1 hypothetical protein [Acinetobacter wanghuae]QGA11120.1 hypothetical protein GFH30_06820 [Acinetobacter wanghuae]